MLPVPAPSAPPGPRGARSGGPTDVVVVGSGPNGLTAAVVLARAGLDVLVLEAEPTPGGGARTVDLGLADGVRHDLCSAVHPMALASPVLRHLDLGARGLELVVPEASFAQPLDGVPAAIAWHDVDRTARELEEDGPGWARTVGALARDAEAVVALALSDKRSVPAAVRDPRGLAAAARFGALVGLQGGPAWDLPLRSVRARALLAGAAAHGIGPLPSPAGAATGLLLAALGHAGGWPIPVGGSQSLTDALLQDLTAHGGRILTGRPVRSARDLPPARAVLLDTTAAAAATLLGTRLPAPLARALRRFPPAAGSAAPVAMVLAGPVPWRDPDVGRAGTQHLGGTREQMAAAERAVAAGRLPDSPVVLVSDPAVADPSRVHDGLRPLWAYAHVSRDCPVDPTELVVAQIERFAPGFRDVLVAAQGTPATDLAAHNRNLTGGDIALGSIALPHMIARPTAAPDPYRLGDTGWYLCSAATPPGPGVHGMSGWHAARRVLAQRFGRRLPADPADLPA